MNYGTLTNLVYSEEKTSSQKLVPVLPYFIGQTDTLTQLLK